jgi:hypothetical protein
MLGFGASKRRTLSQKLAYIVAYEFPPSMMQIMTRSMPQSSSAEIAGTLCKLKHYFSQCAENNGELVKMEMGSQVDFAWHLFILSTRAYTEFCLYAFGSYFHHTPPEDDFLYK